MSPRGLSVKIHLIKLNVWTLCNVPFLYLKIKISLKRIFFIVAKSLIGVIPFSFEIFLQYFEEIILDFKRHLLSISSSSSSCEKGKYHQLFRKKNAHNTLYACVCNSHIIQHSCMLFYCKVALFTSHVHKKLINLTVHGHYH